MGYNPCGGKQSDMTEWPSTQTVVTLGNNWKVFYSYIVIYHYLSTSRKAMESAG